MAVTAVNTRSYDAEIELIADYVVNGQINSPAVFEMAHLCLLDALACALKAQQYPACSRVLGPMAHSQTVPFGARVPGTDFELSSVEAAYSLGTAIRWLDFNDTWLAAEWGHPSDNLGAILAVADEVSRQRRQQQLAPLTMRDVLQAMVKAYEIQGVIALENSFNRVGLDHVILVKLASAALATHLLGGDIEQVKNAISQVFVDGQALRTYRHAPNTGSRKSWAAGDATSRGVWLAKQVMRGEMGYPSALTAPEWGFYAVSFAGQRFKLAREFSSYVIENILFKVGFPAEFHGQTAVEAAITLHPAVKDRLADIEKMTIRTQASAMRIINKTGELHNPADRDHCLQYMVAVGLIWGEVTSDHYSDDHYTQDPRVAACRRLMVVSEDEAFSRDYLDPAKRSIGNELQVFFADGSHTDPIRVDYPLGHLRRRDEAKPLLQAKFHEAVTSHFKPAQQAVIGAMVASWTHYADMAVDDFMGCWVT